MEDQAEVQLLEQHLLKTRQISQKMTSILGKLDHRLIKLEKAVAPLNESNRKLTRRIQNIEATMASIDKLSTQHESVADEGALILRGPRLENLRTYTDIIERLNVNVAFGGSDRNTAENARLVEAGAKKLSQLYTKIVAEASSGSTPLSLSSPTTTLPPALIAGFDRPNSTTKSEAPFSASLLTSLQPVVASLRKMPLPSTHPSHPTAVSILGALKDAQRGYAEMRGGWARKCLEVGGRRIKERVDSATDDDEGGRSGRSGRNGMEGGPGMGKAEEIAKWIGEVIEVADAEYERLASLALLTTPQQLKQTYTALLAPVLKNLTTITSTLITIIKKDLPRYTFLALCLFTLLQPLQAPWEDAIGSRVIADDGAGGEFKETLTTLRGICVRSFPEVLVDVQSAALISGSGAGGETSVGTSVTGITKQIVKYLNRLPDVLPAVNTALQNLGDGNWKMGAGVGKGGNIRAKGVGVADEGELLEHFINDVVTAMIQTLTTLSQSHKRPPLASIFLLNNISTLRLHLLANPSSSIDELLSKPTREALNSAFRSSKADYFSANFGPLSNALVEEKEASGLAGVVGAVGVGPSSKSLLKERWMRYWEVLEEIVERHRFARILGDDDEGRGLLADEAVKMVIPQLERFMAKNREKDFTKNVGKYIKMTPVEVENTIRDMYR